MKKYTSIFLAIIAIILLTSTLFYKNQFETSEEEKMQLGSKISQLQEEKNQLNKKVVELDNELNDLEKGVTELVKKIGQQNI